MKSYSIISGGATVGIYNCVQSCKPETLASSTTKCCQTDNCNTPSKAATLQASHLVIGFVALFIGNLLAAHF